MFKPLLDVITQLASDLFSFLVGLIIIVVIIGIVYNALKASAFSLFGGSQTTAVAILGTAGLVLLTLFTFLIIPQIHKLLEQWAPKPPFGGVPVSLVWRSLINISPRLG
jgi:hypothetical protein